MLKIASAVAATALTVGTFGYNQYHTLYVKLNQAQAQVREEQTRNADLAFAATGVVSAVSQLQEALARDQDAPSAQADSATHALASMESSEPSLSQAKSETP